MRKLNVILLALAVMVSAAAIAHPGDHRSIEELGELLAINPAQPALLIARGSLYTYSGQWKKAESDLVLAMNTGNKVNVTFELARLYFHTGAYRKALDFIDQYIDSNPDYAPAFLMKARIAEASQQKDIAIKSYGTYFEKTANPHPGDYLASAQLLSSTGTSGIARAIDVLDAGINEIGLIPQLQRYAMKLELDRGEQEKAINRWHSLKQQLGASPRYKITLAQLLILTHKITEARQMTKAVRDQLSRLKKTPANDALARKLSELERQLG
jgi:predicted Zn-dependent protease